MSALRKVGVPYTQADIDGAEATLTDKVEIDALVAYLQQLGTLLKARR
jgi:cytochrome c oxidase cbb3-type subunit 2